MIKVMVVDNEQGMTDLLTMIIKDLGYDVVGVTDPFVAEKEIDDFMPDLILLDVIMNGPTGIDILGRVKKKYPQMKVLMMSVAISPYRERFMEESFALGADKYWDKAFVEGGAREVQNVVKEYADKILEEKKNKG